MWFVRVGPGVVAAAAAGNGGDGTPEMTVSQAFRSRAFIVLALAFFACCAAHSGPIFHTVSYAIGCGLPMTAAATYLGHALDDLSASDPLVWTALAVVTVLAASTPLLARRVRR